MKLLSLKSILLFITVLLLPQHLFGGTVTVLPMSPKEGATVTIEYVPDAVDNNIVEGGKLHAVLYGFTVEAESPRASEVVLEKSGSKWIGNATLAKNIVYTILKVGNGMQYDTNRELYWSSLRHLSGGLPYAVRTCALQWPGTVNCPPHAV